MSLIDSNIDYFYIPKLHLAVCNLSFPVMVEVYDGRVYCETCLSLGRKMFPIDQDVLQSICPGFQLSVTNKQVCWECRSIVHKWVKFRDRVVKAQETLADYSNRDTMELPPLSKLCVKMQCKISIGGDSMDADETKESDHEIMKVEPLEYNTPGVLDSDETDAQSIKVIKKEKMVKTKRKTKEAKSIKASSNKKRKKSDQKLLISPDIVIQGDNPNDYINLKYSNQDGGNEKAIAKKVRLDRDRYTALMNHTRKRRKFVHSKLPKCVSCVAIFENEDLYQQHLNMHKESAGPHACKICERRFKTQDLLSTHEEEEHFESCMQCAACGELFLAAWDLSHHYRESHAPTHAACSRCQLKFSTLRELRSHRNSSHRDRAVYACDHCGNKLTTKTNLLKHIRNLHLTKRVTTKCPICFRVLKGDWSHVHEYHIKKHVQPRPPVDKNEDSFCVECSIQYASVKNYKQHIKEKHEGETRSACPHCGKLFRNLKSHIDSTHSTELKYECPECDKKFKTNYSRNNHLRFSHANLPKPKNKICTKCSKSFGSKRQLEDHMNSHTGARPHVCVHCSATFGHRSALFTHTRLKHTRTNQ